MALSKKDREFYAEKLNFKSFVYLGAATASVGGIGWPLLFFAQDWSNGYADKWTPKIALGWFAIGLMIGSMVAAVLYMLFSFLLEMGWLPSRRD